jgi:hypothetical protein
MLKRDGGTSGVGVRWVVFMAGMLICFLPALAPSADAVELSGEARKCQKAIGDRGRAFKRAYLEAWGVCLDKELKGGSCNTKKRDKRIAKARIKFQKRIDRKCAPRCEGDERSRSHGGASDHARSGDLARDRRSGIRGV